MANALTYLLAGLGGGVPGLAKGYGDAETERKASAKKLLLEAMELGAPSDRIGALYKAANAPGTIESLFGAKGPSEEAAKTYGVDYGKAMARKRRAKILELLPKDLDPKVRMAMIREDLNFDDMQDEPATMQGVPSSPPPAPIVTPERRAEAFSGDVPGTLHDEDLGGQTLEQAMGADNAERILEERHLGKVTLPGEHPGMVAPGNIDLDSRKVLKNKDGSISTELTFSTRIRDASGVERETLLPMVVNGEKVNKEEAIKHFYDTGEHLGAFSTPEAATTYAQQLHERQATQYGQPPAAQPAPTTSPAPSTSPPLPAPTTEDPRKVAIRKYFTSSGGLKEGADLKIREKVDERITVFPDGTAVKITTDKTGRETAEPYTMPGRTTSNVAKPTREEGPWQRDYKAKKKFRVITETKDGKKTTTTQWGDAIDEKSGKTPPDANGNYKTFKYLEGQAEDLSNALPGTIKPQVRPKPQPPQRVPKTDSEQAADRLLVRNRINGLLKDEFPYGRNSTNAKKFDARKRELEVEGGIGPKPPAKAKGAANVRDLY